ncbi:MAG: helix-turn-helix transcriptional regulator [Lachnospiraceae bacterium]|nr:helix-turn-helix transcriptional regulator [Lachnospiraceae bacterium]
MQKIKCSKTLGAHLKTLRLEAGLGATELAKYMQLLGCHTTRECWVKIEAGAHNISSDQLWAFKEALHISYDKIFEYTEEEK